MAGQSQYVERASKTMYRGQRCMQMTTERRKTWIKASTCGQRWRCSWHLSSGAASKRVAAQLNVLGQGVDETEVPAALV